MCGIVGYTGPLDARDVLINGLKRLEYRGYDSAGVSVVSNGEILTVKKAGKLANLEAELDRAGLPRTRRGIGHTRWATHGGPTDSNAHPHMSNDARVSVIHNGIIENFAELRAELLAQGTVFNSETDSEAVAHLLAAELANGARDLTAAMATVAPRLEGTYTLLAIDASEVGVIVGARKNSPLVVGVSDQGNFLASDVAAFVDYTDQALELGQEQIVTICADGVIVTDFHGNTVSPAAFTIDWDASAAGKDGYKLFMHKEINEQPTAVANCLSGRIQDCSIVLPEVDAIDLDKVTHLTIVACGTAAYAGMTAAYAIEQWAQIPVRVELASEFRYRNPFIEDGTLMVSVSQSGETMDTLMAVRYAEERGLPSVAVCNSVGSTIARESTAAIYTHAGPEIAVASTKAFVTQIAALYLLGIRLAVHRRTLTEPEACRLLQNIESLPELMDETLSTLDPVKRIAAKYQRANSVLFIARHANYPVALEGALKLKELAYMHAEGFAAGELKHGPIALIEDGIPVIAILPSPMSEPDLHQKVISNIQEVRARSARIIAIADSGDQVICDYADDIVRIPVAPKCLRPILSVMPLQMFACDMATLRGYDVDQPRNLAKSVTVE